ncbi:MAG: DUF308 domain-containing protein [Akkermansia sp.]|nr:DUF308 domain-containing protein [Akkermansia sp.]
MDTHNSNFWGRMAGNTWVVSILAVLELVLGFILLGFPLILGASAVWVGGFVLLIAGVLRFVHVFSYGYNRWWNLLTAILYLFTGGVMMYYTGQSLAMLTLLIGVALLVGGTVRLVVAFSMLKSPGSTWRFFNAIISLILGGMVVYGWPDSSLWLIGTIIAVEMIFSGWTLLFMALPARREEA